MTKASFAFTCKKLEFYFMESFIRKFIYSNLPTGFGGTLLYF